MKKYFFYSVISVMVLLGVGVCFKQYGWSRIKLYLFEQKIEQMTAKTKILLVTCGVEQNGAQIMLLNLAKILKKNNYDVAIFSYHDGELKEDFVSMDIPVLIETEESVLKKLLNKFDLVVVNTMYTSTSYALAHKLKPTIWWLHESGLHSSVCGLNYNFSAKLKQYFSTLRTADDVVLVSDLLKSTLAKCMDGKREIIHNIISDAPYEESAVSSDMKRDREAGKMVFLSVGRVDVFKGHDVLVEAIRRLEPQYRDNAVFYVVGNNKHKEAQQWRQDTQDLPQLKWIGEVPKELMRSIYQNTDVLLHPASYVDACALVVLEAARENVPAVITEKTGSTYIIKDGQSGFVIPAKDAEILADKIRWFMDNPEQIKPLGIKAHEYYLQTSSPEVFEQQWLKKIEDTLNHKQL